MNQKTLLTTIIVVSIIMGALGYRMFTNSASLGSVSPDGAYTYKNITITDASSTAAVAIPIKGGAGTLGSVVFNTVNSSSTISVYDSASGATNLIAKFPVSATVGTYTFDVAVRNGITIVPTTGFNGNMTITYR